MPDGRRDKKNPPWTKEEKRNLARLVQERRAAESKDLLMHVLRDIPLFTLVAKQLEELDISPVLRNAYACKNQWNRYCRADSGFDERGMLRKSQSLTTSAQT